jgi:outer membrane protein assembly factor BamB
MDVQDPFELNQTISGLPRGEASMRVLGLGIALLVALSWPVSAAAEETKEEAGSITAASLAGAWSGVISHDGDTTPFALELDPDPDGKVLVKISAPVVHVVSQEIGKIEPKIEGSEIHLGPFSFTYDRAADTLTGVMPAGKVYALQASTGKLLWKTDTKAPVVSTPAWRVSG